MSIKISQVKNHETRRMLEALLAATPQKTVQLTGHSHAIGTVSTNLKRIRQGEKPPNKLEANWNAYLARTLPPGAILRAQSIRLRIGCGAWYKPDVAAMVNGKLMFWETKGPAQMKNVARGILALKVAASNYPEFTFILVWKIKGEWHTQVVIP